MGCELAAWRIYAVAKRGANRHLFSFYPPPWPDYICLMLKFNEDAIVADFTAAQLDLQFHRKDLERMVGLTDTELFSWPHLVDITNAQSTYTLENVITKVLEVRQSAAVLATLGKVLNVPQDVMAKLLSGETVSYIPPGYDNPPF